MTIRVVTAPTIVGEAASVPIGDRPLIGGLACESHRLSSAWPSSVREQEVEEVVGGATRRLRAGGRRARLSGLSAERLLEARRQVLEHVVGQVEDVVEDVIGNVVQTVAALAV